MCSSDLFCGTGTTPIITQQLNRKCICCEKSNYNYEQIIKRIADNRATDNIYQFLNYYKFTKNLNYITGIKN